MKNEKARAQLTYASLLFAGDNKTRFKHRELLVEFGEFLFELCNIDLSALGLEEKMERIYRELFAEKDFSGPPLMDVEIFPAQEDVDEGSMWVKETFNDEYRGPTYTSFLGEQDEQFLDLRMLWGRAVPYQVTKHIIYEFLLSKGFIYVGGASTPPSEEECYFELKSAGINLHINLKYHHPSIILGELIYILERLPTRLRIGKRGTCQEVDMLLEELRVHEAKYRGKFIWAGHVLHPLERPFVISDHLNVDLG